MHVVAPKVASTCTSKCPKGEWTEKTMITLLHVTSSVENLADEGDGGLRVEAA